VNWSDDDDDDDNWSLTSNITQRKKSIHEMTDEELLLEHGDMIADKVDIKKIIDDDNPFFDDANNPAWQGLLDSVSEIIGDEDKTVDDLINPKLKDNKKQNMKDEVVSGGFEDGIIDDIPLTDKSEYEEYNFEEFFTGYNF